MRRGHTATTLLAPRDSSPACGGRQGSLPRPLCGSSPTEEQLAPLMERGAGSRLLLPAVGQATGEQQDEGEGRRPRPSQALVAMPVSTSWRPAISVLLRWPSVLGVRVSGSPPRCLRNDRCRGGLEVWDRPAAPLSATRRARRASASVTPSIRDAAYEALLVPETLRATRSTFAEVIERNMGALPEEGSGAPPRMTSNRMLVKGLDVFRCAAGDQARDVDANVERRDASDECVIDASWGIKTRRCMSSGAPGAWLVRSAMQRDYRGAGRGIEGGRATDRITTLVARAQVPPRTPLSRGSAPARTPLLSATSSSASTASVARELPRPGTPSAAPLEIRAQVLLQQGRGAVGDRDRDGGQARVPELLGPSRCPRVRVPCPRRREDLRARRSSEIGTRDQRL